MPSYLSMLKWTEQGIKNVKQSPGRLDAVKAAAKEAGGRVVFFYMTMGEYDLVTLMELPNDEAASRLFLSVGMHGNIRSTTMKAFTEDEYRKIIGSLP